MRTLHMKIRAMILLAFVLLAACSDNGCEPVKPEAEESQILAYAAANGITATRHSTGMYYQVMNPGSGVTPNQASKVYVIYTGKHMDGTVFDQATSPVSFMLQGLIEGWKVGLPLIQKGGHIKLLVPSAMGYGCSSSSGAMPPNSVLYFDIQLIDVQ